MERKNYDVCASEYDEDGNEVEEPSYNEYGDYVVYRPNSTSEKPIYGLPVNYTVKCISEGYLYRFHKYRISKISGSGNKSLFYLLTQE